MSVGKYMHYPLENLFCFVRNRYLETEASKKKQIASFHEKQSTSNKKKDREVTILYSRLFLHSSKEDKRMVNRYMKR